MLCRWSSTYLSIEKDVVCKDEDAEAGVEEDKEVLEAGAGEEKSCDHGAIKRRRPMHVEFVIILYSRMGAAGRR